LNAEAADDLETTMGTFGPIHWIILGAIALLLFGGRGKLSSIMGDAAKGVRAFRDGLKGDDDKPHEAAVQPLPAPAPEKDPIVR
jgi:sec-independent protein translocase protein TatA